MKKESNNSGPLASSLIGLSAALAGFLGGFAAVALVHSFSIDLIVSWATTQHPEWIFSVTEGLVLTYALVSAFSAAFTCALFVPKRNYLIVSGLFILGAAVAFKIMGGLDIWPNGFGFAPLLCCYFGAGLGMQCARFRHKASKLPLLATPLPLILPGLSAIAAGMLWYHLGAEGGKIISLNGIELRIIRPQTSDFSRRALLWSRLPNETIKKFLNEHPKLLLDLDGSGEVHYCATSSDSSALREELQLTLKEERASNPPPLLPPPPIDLTNANIFILTPLVEGLDVCGPLN